MEHTRRAYVALSVGAVSGLTGCIGAITSNGESDDDESNGENTEETSDGQSNENTASNNNEKQSQQDEQSTSQRVQTQIAELHTFLQWMMNEYSQNRFDYFRKLDSVATRIEQLQKKPIQNVNASTVETLASEIRAVNDVIVNEFGEYYGVHYNFSARADELENKVAPSLRRREYEYAKTQLTRTERNIGLQRKPTQINRWFPQNIIHREPFKYFTNKETIDEASTSKIFETYSKTNTGDEIAIYGTPGHMNITQNPLGKEPPGPLPSTSHYPQTEPRTPALIETANALQPDSLTPIQDTKMNIIMYNEADNVGGYPVQYVGTDINRAKDIRDLKEPNFNKRTETRNPRRFKLGTHIQEFNSTDTAQTALNTTLNSVTKTGEITLGGITYTDVYSPDALPNKTIYANITQSDRFLISINITTNYDYERGEHTPKPTEFVKRTFLDGH